MKSEIKVRKGTQYSCIHFSAKIEIKEGRPDKDQLDVILIPSDNHAWQETWSLEQFKAGVESGKYKELEPEINYGI